MASEPSLDVLNGPEGFTSQWNRRRSSHIAFDMFQAVSPHDYEQPDFAYGLATASRRSGLGSVKRVICTLPMTPL